MLLFFIHRSLNPGPLQFVKAHVKSQIALIRFASAAADLVHGEAEIGSRLLDGDASLRVLPEVLARGGYRSPVFFRLGVRRRARPFGSRRVVPVVRACRLAATSIWVCSQRQRSEVKRAASHLPQPLVQMLAHEGIVIQVRIRAIDAFNLLGLPRIAVFGSTPIWTSQPNDR